MTTIAPSTTATTADIDRLNSQLFAGTRKPSDTLDQNSFLKLLVTQLQNQDPSSPMTNNDFAQQVTSFSSLQASQSMQSDMAWMRSSSLIGSEVQVMPANSTNQKDLVKGVVTSVSLVEGVPQITLNGDPNLTFKMSQVQHVSLAKTAA
jgi:flagellar basal-body rod modification protein FlgD